MSSAGTGPLLLWAGFVVGTPPGRLLRDSGRLPQLSGGPHLAGRDRWLPGYHAGCALSPNSGDLVTGKTGKAAGGDLSPNGKARDSGVLGGRFIIYVLNQVRTSQYDLL